MNYDEVVSKNLKKCFNQNDEFINSKDYIDPDMFSYFKDETISPKILIQNKTNAEKHVFTIGFKADGLISIKKIKKVVEAINKSPDIDISKKNPSEKYLYAFLDKK